ncbi:SDR family NAD(P)-dependent oxidoreductase [Streptomyces resistomycificus]|uniref:SDR family NAD(P)-dependent oxidoreductase n=1 Tax=Streptomyces resistomycificus TaxID=67356 RepID=UPI000A8954F6|nr:SDR family oxidoreductase [Streptomyces resistomycificus]
MTNFEGNSSSRGVIVTGGGTGIGRATARAFADRQDRVLVVGRSESTLTETAQGHPNIHALPVDITEPGAAETIVGTALSAFGRIDVVVNNASIALPAPLEKTDTAAAGELLDVNLCAPISLTRCALDALTKTRGTVVNLSSAGSLGRRAWPNFSLYGASKVALDFLTRTWAVELAPRGIRVVSIAPGVIETGMGIRMGSSSEEYAQFLEWMKTVTPLGRVGQPEEIAWWVLQVAEPEAGFATGAVLAVDGGASIV